MTDAEELVRLREALEILAHFEMSHVREFAKLILAGRTSADALMELTKRRRTNGRD